MGQHYGGPVPPKVQDKIKSIREEFEIIIAKRLLCEVTYDGEVYLNLVKRANHEPTPREEWPWRHTITAIVARSADSLEDFQDRVAVDCLEAIPPAFDGEDGDIGRLDSALAKIRSDASRIASVRMDKFSGKSPGQDLEYLHLYVTSSQADVRRLRRSGWIPLVVDRHFQRRVENASHAMKAGVTCSPYQFGECQHAQDTHRILSLLALSHWRPPRWFMQQRYGFATPDSDVAISDETEEKAKFQSICQRIRFGRTSQGDIIKPTTLLPPDQDHILKESQETTTGLRGPSTAGEPSART